MKPLNKLKGLAVVFLSVAVFSGIVVSCSSVTANEQSAMLENSFGTIVTVKSLCSDSAKTTLILQTDLDAEFWQLTENDFYPEGKTYFETSIIFLENNELYSSASSGTRDDPVFDSQKHIVSTIQTFFFPRSPLPDSEFTVRARVYLYDLPTAYTPPAGVRFVEPGIIEVPMEYDLSPTLSECP